MRLKIANTFATVSHYKPNLDEVSSRHDHRKFATAVAVTRPFISFVCVNAKLIKQKQKCYSCRQKKFKPSCSQLRKLLVDLLSARTRYLYSTWNIIGSQLPRSCPRRLTFCTNSPSMFPTGSYRATTTVTPSAPVALPIPNLRLLCQTSWLKFSVSLLKPGLSKS